MEPTEDVFIQRHASSKRDHFNYRHFWKLFVTVYSDSPRRAYLNARQVLLSHGTKQTKKKLNLVIKTLLINLLKPFSPPIMMSKLSYSRTCRNLGEVRDPLRKQSDTPPPPPPKKDIYFLKKKWQFGLTTCQMPIGA